MGGGSGGHVTPVVAVLNELRARHPRVELRFWCDFPFATQARSIVAVFDPQLPVHRIVAGKLRRYHHLTLWQQLTWSSLVLKNLRDMFLVGIGLVQSLVKLLIWRPDVVFTKGGYVCLPVGVAARLLRIPLVIHDSDAHPGLTNRILAKWATAIGTGAPLHYYPYNPNRSQYVGIPIASKFVPYSPDEQRAAKREWGIDETQPLIVVTGGGLGASRINLAVAKSLHHLQRNGSVILVAGAGQYDALRAELPQDGQHFQLYPFVTNMHSLLGAADVVVTRAGMTTILELAALEKPTILVPNAKLTGGHQLKNAAMYAEAGAVIVVDEDEMERNPLVLVATVATVLDDPTAAKAMAKRFSRFSKPNAAKDMATMILAARRRTL